MVSVFKSFPATEATEALLVKGEPSRDNKLAGATAG